MAKNSKDVYGAKGKTNVLLFDPADLTIVTDEKSALFDKRGLEDRTIATKLHGAGYRTGYVGKYLNGGFTESAAAGYRPPGWDQFVAFMEPSPSYYYDYTLTDGTSHGHEPAAQIIPS